MYKKKILVILGGVSKERKISLQTGSACLKAIKRLGFQAKQLDPKKNFLNEIDKSKTDIIFNALHGKDGEDGNAQSIFEYLKIPYTHSGVISSMNAMDKVISKKIFKKNKILTPNYFVLKSNEITLRILKILIKKNNLSFPIVVKPTNEGSSIGVKICNNLQVLKKQTYELKKKI